jgi:predicted enzyme related to lactoylglutathione lyase
MDLLVNLDVDDVRRAIAFYRDALGLRLGRRLFGGAVAEMTGGSSRLYLLEKPAGSAPFPGASVLRAYDRHWTPVHLDFEVEDVEAAVARAVAAGATLEAPPQSFEWGTLALLSDPFGHGFCVLRFTGRGYDAVSSPAAGVHPAAR